MPVSPPCALVHRAKKVKSLSNKPREEDRGGAAGAAGDDGTGRDGNGDGGHDGDGDGEGDGDERKSAERRQRENEVSSPPAVDRLRDGIKASLSCIALYKDHWPHVGDVLWSRGLRFFLFVLRFCFFVGGIVIVSVCIEVGGRGGGKGCTHDDACRSQMTGDLASVQCNAERRIDSMPELVFADQPVFRKNGSSFAVGSSHHPCIATSMPDRSRPGSMMGHAGQTEKVVLIGLSSRFQRT